MKCKNCDIELEESKTRPRVFCSDKCTKAYNRRLENGQLDKITDKITDKKIMDTPKKITDTEITDKLISNTTNRWGEDVKKMDAKTLYAYIDAYEHDTWKDSPEYKELISRLNTYTLDKLRDGGYEIPSAVLKRHKV